MRTSLGALLSCLVFMTVGCCPPCSGEPAAEVTESLNKSAGKVFDVDPVKMQFRFLKQDSNYNPVTGEGAPWHTVQWTGQTVFMQYEGRRNFRDIKGPVLVEFSGLDATNLAAARNGEPFEVEKGVLRPDRKDATGISADGTEVVGWFTPRQARFSRDGMLRLGDREIKVNVKRGGVRISIQKQLPAGDFAQGVWKATLTGHSAGDVFLADRVRLEPLPDRAAEDDPKLPRVLSVGDSISMNYFASTRDGLKGVANYHRIEDNCWSTARGKAFAPYWLGDYAKKGHHWDVILFNSGMHDMKQKTPGGPYVMPLETYKTNLRREIEILKETGAKLIFVTTTPVPNDGGSPQYAYRSKGAEKDFNKAARELLREFPEIRILDLAKVVHDSKVMETWRKGRDVHYWKSEEQAVLGDAVTEAVKKVLAAAK